MLIGKISIAIVLYIITVISSQHVVNKFSILFIQIIFFIAALTPVFIYLWDTFFIFYKTQLHRNVIFISLTGLYFLFSFCSGYVMDYGWKKIIYYVIIQAYGVNLAYLTNA